jgi:HK97 gp10 family phage protein
MAKALVTLTGDKEMKKAFRAFENKSEDAFTKAMNISAQTIRTAAIRLIMKGARSGAQYTVGGKTAQRSAPGEPPKSDTGHLVANIDATIDADGGGATVGTNVDYGLWLEVGTSKMAARPWLMPSFEMLKPEIIKRFQNVIAKTAKKAGKKT